MPGGGWLCTASNKERKTAERSVETTKDRVGVCVSMSFGDKTRDRDGLLEVQVGGLDLGQSSWALIFNGAIKLGQGQRAHANVNPSSCGKAPAGAGDPTPGRT